MGTVIVACIILHSMIIEDEYTDPKLDNEYLRRMTTSRLMR